MNLTWEKGNVVEAERRGAATNTDKDTTMFLN